LIRSNGNAAAAPVAIAVIRNWRRFSGLLMRLGFDARRRNPPLRRLVGRQDDALRGHGAVDWPRALAMRWSLRATPHPSWRKPPRVSLSSPPGAFMTPSRVTWLMGFFRRSPAGAPALPGNQADPVRRSMAVVSMAAAVPPCTR
jgi:hypothetical protein